MIFLIVKTSFSFLFHCIITNLMSIGSVFYNYIINKVDANIITLNNLVAKEILKVYK